MCENWEHMMDFVDELIKHADIHYKNKSGINQYISERISIIHFDHAMELFMKAYLIKRGYLIYKINNRKILEGVKKDALVTDIMNEDRTLDFIEILDVFVKILKLPVEKKNKILEFHRLRNEIQHRALNFNVVKNKQIENLKPVLHEIYEMGFKNRKYPLDKGNWVT